jgi:MscS family membrane protein
MKNTSCYCVLLVLLSFVSSAYGRPTNQEKEPAQNQAADQANENAKQEKDPLGRNTPHETVFGFLQHAQNGNYKEATQYLQLSRNERVLKGEHIARQLHALMDNAFVGRVGTISDRREGSVQVDVPKDHERIGMFRINGNETVVDLVRVSDPVAGEIWLFPSTLLADVPDLFDQIESNDVESRLPAFMRTRIVLSTPLWRLVASLLLIPVCFGLAWGAVKVLRSSVRLWLRRKRSPYLEDAYRNLFAPAILILTVVFHQIGVYLLGIPLLIRLYYQRIVGVVLAAGVAWLIVRLVNQWGERARVKALAGSGYRTDAIVLLGQRILSVLVVIVAALAMLSILGFDISTIVAGLGIGSIAIAFAAQKTLENLLGGISILGDQVIRVGDFCQIGDDEGTVEDISLRSTRIRTLDRSELSVPNGQLANMNVENLSRRDKSLFRTQIKLRQGTSPEQLQSLLTEMRELLDRHPKVDPNVARVRLVGFGDSSLDVEVHCYILTTKLDEFLAIREDLLLQIMKLLSDSGTGFAVPLRAIHMAQDQDMAHQRKTRPDSVSVLRRPT